MKKYMGSWALMEYEEGLEKGLVNGQQKMLLRLMQKKYGPVPEWAEEKLKEADDATLDKMADAILDASNLDELFAA